MSKKDRLEKFIREREQNKDWASYVSKDGCSLVKQRVSGKCKVPRSSFYQDEAIKQMLFELESELKRRGVLKTDDSDNTRFKHEELAVEVRLSDLNLRLDALQMRIHALSKLTDDSRSFGLKPSGA
jgi:hypothetical protein